MNKLYIAAITNYTEEHTDIYTASSEELLLKELEACISFEKKFKTKKDVEKYFAKWEDETGDVIKVQHKVINLK